jgi:hypothetical protein
VTALRWLLAAVLANVACSQSVSIQVSGPDSGRICVSFTCGQPGEIELWRSTARLEGEVLDTVRWPITVFRTRESGLAAGFTDTLFASGVTYYYRARNGGGWSRLDSAVVPAVPLARSPDAPPVRLVVDKVHYLLEVWRESELARRYPVALGVNPVNRKLWADHASTPEGAYRITATVPESRFHRSYCLNYPNEADRCRYELLRTPQMNGIGGAIEIHGLGIGRNWTLGCVALRDADIDELFADPAIRAGTPVDIVGREMTREDVACCRAMAQRPAELRNALIAAGFGPAARAEWRQSDLCRALGRFQQARGLPVTGDADLSTVAALGLAR